jgi:trk system potassium uptake protein TrkH
LTPASQFLSVILMFIGASPGGTGGGIKTTTFALLLLAVMAIVRNRPGVESFGRTIPGDIVNKAITVVFLAASLVAGATVAVLVLENKANVLFIQVLFEVTSAFGTVGLSTGITSSLGPAAKVVLCLVMLAGRIGPLTLVLAISQQGPKPAYAYPRGTVMVG